MERSLPIDKPPAALSKARTVTSLWILLLGLVSIAAMRYYVDFAAWMTGGDPTQIADLGVDILQPMFVSISYVCMGIVFSSMVARFLERQLRPDAFGKWSRFGITFCLCFVGFCWLAAAIL